MEQLGALGKLSGAIQARLFSGLETRLGGVATQLDRRFEEKFREQLEAGFAEGDALGPLTRSVKTNAEIRVGVSGAVFAGGALSVKAASMLIAKKLGAKIAIKAAAKAGAKWAVVATGAGGGALACSWAGPVAAICGAGGAVVAWVATDVAVIKLDELMTRDEFEANLQALIDEDKGARRAQLEAALTAKAQTVQVGSDKAVQDFNLKQLSGGASDEVCSTADFLVTQYGIYRDDVRERNPDSLTAFQANFSVYKKDLSLRPLVLEIEENLGPVGLRFTVSGIAIRGNLPSDYRTNGDISGRIALNGQTVEFERLSATSDDGFDLRSSSPTELRDISLTKFEVALEQHRRVFTNRLFGGAITRDLFDAMPETKGLEHGLTLLVPIEIDEEAESIREVNARPASGNIVAVDLTVRGEPLPELQYLLNCDR
jgi:hypothetical protein